MGSSPGGTLRGRLLITGIRSSRWPPFSSVSSKKTNRSLGSSNALWTRHTAFFRLAAQPALATTVASTRRISRPCAGFGVASASIRLISRDSQSPLCPQAVEQADVGDVDQSDRGGPRRHRPQPAGPHAVGQHKAQHIHRTFDGSGTLEGFGLTRTALQRLGSAEPLDHPAQSRFNSESRVIPV